MAGNVAYQVGPPATQLEVVHLITPAVKASTQPKVPTAATTALLRVPLAVGSVAAVSMQRIEEEVVPANDEAQALSDATWEHNVDGDASNDAASGLIAADGPDDEAEGDDAAASEPELAADAAAGDGGGAAGHEAPAARPRQRKRANPQRARLHSQALVMSPVQTVAAAEPVEPPLPLVTVGAGPVPKRRRTRSGRKPRNALQARLEAAVGDTDGEQDGTMRQAGASSGGHLADGSSDGQPHSKRREHSTAVAGQDEEVSADATEPLQNLQPTRKRSKRTNADAAAETGQPEADRPRRRGSKVAAAGPDAACQQPSPRPQDTGRPKTGKRKSRSDEDAATAVGSRRAATAAKATVASSPRRRRTVAMLDPRLGGTVGTSGAGNGSAAGRSVAKGTVKPGDGPCFALRGLHTEVLPCITSLT